MLIKAELEFKPGGLSPEPLPFATTTLGCFSKQIDKDCEAKTRLRGKEFCDGLKCQLSVGREAAVCMHFKYRNPGHRPITAASQL